MKNKSYYYYKLLFYWNLVKATIKSDRILVCVSTYRKSNINSIQLKTDGTLVQTLQSCWGSC
jgi:hypothetical protein